MGTLLGAAILGVIITVMEEGEFPGWFPMIMCVLAAGVPEGIISVLTPPALFFIGPAVGTACATVAISYFCQMTVNRAFIAASIYFAFRMALAVLFLFILK